MDLKTQTVNRLVDEKSPYLLQHAHNPVDWHPWGDEAFDKAKKEDKPVLVSIGYSTCHWCHVMADESFSDQETAEIMNRYFVNIKVDREERPDIDRIYISAVSAMTGSAGWPLNVFLTPDGRPFFGGTYFPPQRRGNPSWKEILTAVAVAYNDPEKHSELLASADKITGVLKNHLEQSGAPETGQKPGWNALDKAVYAFSSVYDPQNGGFSNAPKFPMPPVIDFLLFYNRFDCYVKSSSETGGTALDMALFTLEKMHAGGIYDHIGGGFHRYSTDDKWHVPHFEKMLYDNAQLIQLYLDAYQMTGNEAFAATAGKSLDYVLRDMTHPEGAFYSAEDADSTYIDVSTGLLNQKIDTKKAEGGFYVWRYDEIVNIFHEKGLNDKDAFEAFAFYYGLAPDGNVIYDPMGEFAGKNILYRANTISQTTRRFSCAENDIRRILESGVQALFDARNDRPRPHLDDKVLVEWNALMISVLASAFVVLEDEKYLSAANKAVSFIRTNMFEEGKQPQLYRRWREGERKIPAMAVDYAFLVQGLLDVYEAGFDAFVFDWAIQLTDRMIDVFYDEKQGGFYATGHREAGSLLVRVKDQTDNVTPSADAVAVVNCMRLYRYTGNARFYRAAEATLAVAADRMEKQPSSVPAMLKALGVTMLKHVEAVVAAAPDAHGTGNLVDIIRAYPQEAVSVAKISGSQDKKTLSAHMPHVADMEIPANSPAVYVCFKNTCREPVYEPEALDNILRGALESPLNTT